MPIIVSDSHIYVIKCVLEKEIDSGVYVFGVTGGCGGSIPHCSWILQCVQHVCGHTFPLLLWVEHLQQQILLYKILNTHALHCYISCFIAQHFSFNMPVDFLSPFLTVEDLERHDGTMQKPYYMSKNLMTILNKKNRGPKNGKGKDWWNSAFRRIRTTVTFNILETSQHPRNMTFFSFRSFSLLTLSVFPLLTCQSWPIMDNFFALSTWDYMYVSRLECD